MSNYHMYRNTTLGVALQETLEEFVTQNIISQAVKTKMMTQFDKSISSALSGKTKNKFNFKATGLKTYRFCDNVWTLVLKDAEFKDSGEKSGEIKVEKVKIVACDGRSNPVNKEIDI